MKIGFLGLLAIVFIVLKLTDTIDWSWWLVLLPLYGGLVVFCVKTLFFYLHHIFFYSKIKNKDKEDV